MPVSNFRRPNNCCKHVIEIKESFSNGSRNDSQSNKNSFSYFSLSSFAKVSAFITILSGIFGLCYQKGMISAMRFGNMQGSYDVKEILYSSLQAYYSFFENISDISAYSIWDKDLYFFMSISVFGCIFLYFIFVNRDDIRNFLESARERMSKHRHNNSAVNYLCAAFIGVIFGVFIKFIQTIGVFLCIAIIAFLLLPSALSFELGKIDAKKAMEKDPCVNLTADQFQALEKESYVRQCTHIVVNNKLLRGMIMLGTQKGYYLRINGAFVYISHDGESCVYSQDMKVSDMKSHETKFPKIESLRAFCHTEDKEDATK